MRQILSKQPVIKQLNTAPLIIKLHTIRESNTHVYATTTTAYTYTYNVAVVLASERERLLLNITLGFESIISLFTKQARNV